MGARSESSVGEVRTGGGGGRLPQGNRRRFGKGRVKDCECEFNYTCRLCLLVAADNVRNKS